MRPLKVLRAGLFERVSTEEQAKYGYSIETQVEALKEYANKNNMKIVDHYCDEGVSGGKPYTKRPEMKRLLDDVQAGKIDIILFTRLDRWFRNVKEYFKVQEILDDHKVEWKAIWEDYDTTTPNGRMAITIFLAIAQNEREKTAERIKDVFERKIKNKESFFGKCSTPFGYTERRDDQGLNRLVKDPELEDAIQEFWDMAVKYENVCKAAKHVNLTYGLTRTKKLWFDMARKEIYTGTYRGVEEYCPAYVSREDWLKLQNRNPIKQTKNNRIYLFTGLLKCPKCDGTLAGSYCSRKNKTTGEIKEYKSYRCKHKDMNLCEFRNNISEMKTELWLVDNLEKLIKNEIESVEIERSKPKPKPKTNIAALNEQLRRLNITYMAGNKTDEEYLREQTELKDAIKKAEEELPYDPANRDLTALQNVLKSNFQSIYWDLHEEDRRRFWRTVVKQIHVEGTKVVSVDFN